MFNCAINYDWNTNHEKPWKCHKCEFRSKYKGEIEAHIKWEHAY